jgi:methylmalonyl-CoA mutase N-terminal domain/subunit
MSLTLQQPLNNISRLSIMALACALGGAGETMTTPLHDEAHALPAEEAIRVGAAIQHIVAHETGAADTVDPLAGSYYVEHLTRRIEDAVVAEIAKIDAMGGALAAIERGYFQRELGREQFERNRELETGARKLVGVNHLVTGEQRREIDIFRLDDDTERRQVERLQKLRAERDNTRVAEALAGVREAAAGPANLVPPILVAVRANATHGEICDAMRDVFGVHHPDSQTSGV